RIEDAARFQRRSSFLKSAWGRGLSRKGVTAAKHHTTRRAGQNFENGKPFGGRLGIGNGSIARFHRRFRQHQRVNSPEVQLRRQSFAMPWEIADDPNPSFSP